MSRSSVLSRIAAARAPLCLGLALGLGACDSQIVLGDSEAALPLAGKPGSAGDSGGGSGSGGSAATAGSPGGGGNAGSGALSGSAGAPSSAGTSSAGDAPIGQPGDVLWSTDHEVGDFSDWQKGGAFYGGEYDWGNSNGYVDIGVGRNGSNGVVADINSVARGETSGGVRMYRRIASQPAYYSCWFRLEESHTVADWWSIFLFHAVNDSLDLLGNDVSLWDVRVVDTPDGAMALQFFDHDVMQGTLADVGGRIQARKWFEVSAYLDYRPPNDTRLVVWLNGTQLFDMKGLHTDVQKNVLWSVGNGGSKLDPEESTLYLDDAAIHQATAP